MRLGEVKQKIDLVVSETKTIIIKSEPQYGGQAQLVQNYSELIDILEYLSTLEWSEVKTTEIVNELLSKYPKGNKTELLPQEEFNKLSSYVNRINQKLPLYYSILETMVEIQDEQIINIKLPNTINSLEELTKFNQRIEKLFKNFQIDGQFEFKEFDTGTSWYEILIVGKLTYRYFLASLKIAQEYLKARTEYFKSKEAKISYEACKKTNENLNEESFKKDWLEAFVREEIKSLVEEKIKETNGETKESLQTKLVIATTALVKELGEGTEFHLSLNPPEFANEESGQLTIDYKKIKSLEPKEEIKKIESKTRE